MPYQKGSPPDRIKGLPEHAQDIWIEAFNSAHKDNPDDEEKCNKIAWGAVKNAGYTEKDGKWIKEDKKKEPDDDDPIQEQLKQRSKIHKNRPIKEEVQLTEAESLGEHKYRVQVINLEPPNVEKRGWSLNERYYSDKSLKSLAEKINGKPLIASGHHRANPEFSDMAGMYSDGRKVPGKKIVTAVVEIIGVAQETVEPFVQKQVSDSQAKLLSLSHNSKGDTYWGTDPQNRKGNIVENITEVFSTDIVFQPGAGGNFEKIAEEYRRKKMQDITKKELKEENPELYKQIQEEALAEEKKEKDKLKEDKDKAEKELTRLKEEKIKEDSRVTAEKLLKESKLDEDQAKGLLEMMVGKTEDEQKKLVEERKDYLRGIAKKMNITELSFDKKVEDVKKGQVTEEQRKIWKQQGFTEEQMEKLAKDGTLLTEEQIERIRNGESLQEVTKK